VLQGPRGYGATAYRQLPTFSTAAPERNADGG